MRSIEQGPVPPILSFEQFSGQGDFPGTIKYNNFYLQFIGDNTLAGPIYREQAHYKRFAEEYPELDADIRHKIQSIKTGNMSTLKQYEQDLYEIYKIMRGYGYSDTELFA